MDLDKLGNVLTQSVVEGTPLTAEAVAGVLTDEELATETARRAALLPEIGSSAVGVSVRSQIEGMLPAAHGAYTHNVKTINIARGRGNKVKVASKKTFIDGAMDALDSPTLDYMETVKDESQGKTLWVPKSAPNAELTAAEVIKLAAVNGHRLGKSLYRWAGRQAFLEKFPAAALSGNNPDSDEPVLHQFAPSTFTPRLYGDVPHQRSVYKALRAENPGVDIHAPALAHSIGGWAIHAGTGLALPTNFDTTYDRSVEVKAVPVYGGDGLYVPSSDVDGSDSSVDNSWAGGDDRGRAWVGSNLNLAT